MATVLLAVGVIALCVILLGVKVFFVKNGRFPSGHIHDNPAMRKRQIHCAYREEIEKLKNKPNERMKTIRAINMTAFLSLCLFLCQCSTEEKKEKDASAPAVTPTEVKMAYIDSDTLFLKYNFAKDINEANQRSQNKLESARQQKASEIQRFAAEMERRYKNNGYLSDESINADQQKLQQMSNDAERYMVNLQNQLANEMNLNMKQVNDSIDKCVSEYAKKKGISVVLDKKTTWYVDNIPNITNDIVKILNDRYLKVDKKKQ